MLELNFTINDSKVTLNVEESARLVDVLRENLFLTGTKEGCSIGECGACTIIMDGCAVNSCLIMASQTEGAVIETVENLESSAPDLQKAFIKHGAIQCGYCTPGMLMSTKALLDKNPKPSEDEIKTALEGNLCRCTGYVPILDAVKATSSG